MPTSKIEIAPIVVQLAWQVTPRVVLDVGPGHGKYGVLLREYLEKPLTIDAIEAEPSYVAEHDLSCFYDSVHVGDVRHAVGFERYDLVLMVDVIEHLDKRDGLALLDRIPGHVIVSTPASFFENPPELPESERHRSLWSLDDFGDRVDLDVSSHGGVIVRLRPLTKHGGLPEVQHRWETEARHGVERARASISTATDYDGSGALAADAVAELIDPGAHETILELGCGDGRVTQFLAKRYGRVYAVDIAPSMLRMLAERRLRNVVAVLSNGLSYAGVPRLDAACSDSVLMHNTKSDVRAILRALRLKLKEGAPFALQLPVYDDPHDATGWIDVGVWTPTEFRALAAQAGFVVERLVANPGRFDWSSPAPNHGALHLLRAV